jgi:N-methylhydantoinase A
LLTFDMGGTTAKAALIKNGAVGFTDVFEVGADISTGSVLASGGGYAVKLPAVDVAEVGAGGGSLVRVDPAGAIRVGPESAGARPGPACYALGNDRPTVTDANVVLGYIGPRSLAGGRIELDRARAVTAVRTHVARPLGLSVEDAALGIRRVANASMVRALKTVSIYRGQDPRLFKLFAFGGNGGLHGPEIAAELGIGEVIVPPAAGVFSAVGLLLADLQSTRTLTHRMMLSEFDATAADRVLEGLKTRVAADLAAPLSTLRFHEFALCRYLGQAYELAIALPEAWRADPSTPQRLGLLFAAAHRERHGHCPPLGTPVEVVSFRVTGSSGSPALAHVRLEPSPPETEPETRPCYFGRALGTIVTEVIRRETLRAGPRPGPLIISEPDGTTLVPPGWSARLDAFDNVIIVRAGREA